MKIVSVQEAVSHVKSGDHVFVHTAAAAPIQLIEALTERHHELSGVKLFHMHTEGPAPYVNPEYSSSFQTKAFFVGVNVRKALETGEADYIPVFLSEIPKLFNKGIIKLDIALVNVSPPEKHGYCWNPPVFRSRWPDGFYPWSIPF